MGLSERLVGGTVPVRDGEETDLGSVLFNKYVKLSILYKYLR